MIYENKDKDLQPVYETLSKLDTIPTKEKGFITYISQFCHVSEDIAKRLYNIMQYWKKRQVQESRDHRHAVIAPTCHLLIRVTADNQEEAVHHLKWLNATEKCT